MLSSMTSIERSTRLGLRYQYGISYIIYAMLTDFVITVFNPNKTLHLNG